MIIDITGIELTPGNGGRDCKGNGQHYDENNILMECCCDECDYLMCCTGYCEENECEKCVDARCPHSLVNRK